LKAILNKLFEYKSLDKNSAKEVLINLTQGKYNPSQMAAFLTVYSMRSITVDELEGFRDAMLELCVPVDLKSYDAMDLCGTGGDGKDTFNISTLSAFIVAGTGQKVAKHGNNGVSSLCGSSNLLNHVGVHFTNRVDFLHKCLEEANICFLHAPLFHPAMKNVAPIRQELGVKTFFNMLGPMVNPSRPKKQIVGVFSLELARLYSYLYQQTDKDYIIIHSLDGYDEVSLTGNFRMISKTKEEELSPIDLGLKTLKQEELYGGDSIEASAKIFIDILKGRGTDAQNSAVIANSGLALHCANPGSTISESIEKAKESLKSGTALKAFEKLVKLRP
jgi:anthranilate phosphoribosyltransferase